MTALNAYVDAVGLFTRLAASVQPTSLFLETAHQRITYAQLTERTQKLATLFAQYGLREGDRVIVSVADEIEISLLFLALIANGLTAILLDPDTKVNRVESIIKTAQPGGIIADEAFFERVPSAKDFPLALVAKPEQLKKGQLFRKLLGQSATVVATDTYPSILTTLLPSALPDQINQSGNSSLRPVYLGNHIRYEGRTDYSS